MKNKIPIMGYYLHASLATRKNLLHSNNKQLRSIGEDFKEINLGVNEHRAMLAIQSKYSEMGYNKSVFKSGVSFSTYEFCKFMGYKQDRKGRFGSKRVKEAVSALLSLSRNTFSVCYAKFLKKEDNQNVYEVVAIPNCHLIDIIYSASNVTEEELEKGRIEEKVSKIHVRIFPKFCSEGYYKLFEEKFYQRLKFLLEKSGRKVSKYHFNFALWYMKQNKKRVCHEINVDKLARLLKIPFDVAHKTRARLIVRKMYEDFKELGYLEKFKIDAPAQKLKTKDILYFSDPTGLIERGVMGSDYGG